MLKTNTKANSLSNVRDGLPLEKQTNLEYSEDVLFNDDYGDPDEENANGDMLKTTNGFGLTTLKNRSPSLDSEKMAPKPSPRKTIDNKYKRNNESSDEDSDNYGDEDEDDDKF